MDFMPQQHTFNAAGMFPRSVPLLLDYFVAHLAAVKIIRTVLSVTVLGVGKKADMESVFRV